MSAHRRSTFRALAAGALAGLLVEALLVLAAQVRSLESGLRADFRIVVALEPGLDAERRGVVEERLLALPGTEAADYVSPEAAVDRLAEVDPAFPKAVALIGDNPVPGSFEVSLFPEAVSQAAEWVKGAETLPEVAEASYSAPAARAVVELQFYARWLSLLLSLAGTGAGLAAAGALWQASRPGLAPGSAGRAASAGTLCLAGFAVGAVAAAVSARLLTGWAPAWPALAAQAGAAFLAWFSAFAWALASEAGPDGARGRERRAAAAALAVALLAASLPARAADARSQRRELEALTKELEKLRAEADRYRDEAGRAERDMKERRAEEKRLQGKIGALRRDLDEADGRRRSLGGKLAAIEAARGEARRRLSREVKDYSRRGPLLAYAGSAGVLEGVVRRGALRAKADYLEGVRSVRDRTADEHAAAERKKASLERKAKAGLSELARTRRSGELAQEAYETTSRRAGEAEARLRALEESRKALANLVRDLERRESKAAQASFKADPAMRPKTLPWPVPGRVVSAFGKRRVEELGTWTIHNGIEIAAAAGTQVRPVRAGEVIYSGPFRSYGNVVIVNHGGGFYSIYGHLAGPLQPKGARARPEVALGAVASGDGRVYLELRQAGRALDPVKWLK
jgi:septal ring factor EnvC (AmiA/AmiB activator)